MYTGVVRLRCFAFVLALLPAATPVLGIVCQMDCQPAATSACHKAGPHEGPTANAAHRCEHDHTAGDSAVLTTASARPSAGPFVGITVATLAHTSLADTRMALFSMHGPPGPISGSSPSHTTVLRI
jgi:hypothetical protein